MGNLKANIIVNVGTIKDGKKREKILEYTIMYKNIRVVTLNISNDNVTVYSREYLPFAFRRANIILATAVYDWVQDRISNMQRTYMNMVYIAREVGRDKNKVIEDSAGISFTDNYWIKTNNVKLTWDELQSLKDENEALSEVALTGILNTSFNLKDDITSLFTTKGYFAKAIMGGYLIKLKKDSVLEYPAYIIGKQLGIDISECAIEGDYVKVKIFTNVETSLVHASELKKYYNTDDEIYNEICKESMENIVLQMQRMFIFNYIIGNPDLHDENYGILYNENFEFVKLAPLYDHNVAFQEWFGGVSRTTMGGSGHLLLDDITKKFIKNHDDIMANLVKINLDEVCQYLNNIQIQELKERIEKVKKWYKE